MSLCARAERPLFSTVLRAIYWSRPRLDTYSFVPVRFTGVNSRPVQFATKRFTSSCRRSIPRDAIHAHYCTIYFQQPSMFYGVRMREKPPLKNAQRGARLRRPSLEAGPDARKEKKHRFEFNRSTGGRVQIFIITRRVPPRSQKTKIQ